MLAAMLDGRVAFALSADLLAEYRDVLGRGVISTRHGRPIGEVDGLVAELTVAGHLRHPPHEPADPEADPPPIAPPGDERVIALLAYEPRAVLVSGDLRLTQVVRGWREVLTAAELVDELGLAP
jgi:hypothetical protein